MAKDVGVSPGKSKDGQKKGWFKRFLERVAKANQKSGGQICAA